MTDTTPTGNILLDAHREIAVDQKAMTDTKPTIDEQSLAYRFWEFLATSGNEPSALDREILDFIKRIHDAEMPVEPECVTRMRRLKDDPTWDIEWTTLRYIDALKAYAKRKDAEADGQFQYAGRLLEESYTTEKEKAALIAEAKEQRERADNSVKQETHNYAVRRAEKAERERDALVAENEGLRKDAQALTWLAESSGKWWIEEGYAACMTGQLRNVVYAAIDNAMAGREG